MLVLNPNTFKSFIKPLIFNLAPETAQGVAEMALKRQFIWKTLSPALRVENGRLEVNVGGIWLDNPIGLAAGYDKNCEVLPSLSALGFGYVTGGTVTESPRLGNPSPRIVRYTRNESLVNSMGFPGKGLDFAANQLERARNAGGLAPVVVSVSGVTVDEIAHCHRRLEPLADAIEVNISSPNTAGLRVFQEPDSLANLLDTINEVRMKPLFVKLPPYLSPELTPSAGSEGQERVMGLARVCVEKGVSALTVANTWPVQDSRLAVGSGGLSGRVVFPDMLNMVREIRSEVGRGTAINACGGISSGQDAWDAIRAGATTVQLYTALVYQGPGIVKRINNELLALMDRNDVGSVSLGFQPLA
jgi:dihydroorotate dehydrogenase